MANLASLLSPLYQPLCFRVDFRSQRWEAPKAVVVVWLLMAVCADLAALWSLGQPAYYRMSGTLLTFLLIIAPPRFTVAASGLYITQAGVSVLLWHLMQPEVIRAPAWLGYAVTYGWQVWCLVAFALLFLNYIRTPKNEFRHRAPHA